MHFSIQKLRDLIKQKKLTYKELGEMIGVSDKTIQNYMLERTKIDVYTLAKLASALEVSVNYFFEADNPKEMAIHVVDSEINATQIAIQHSGDQQLSGLNEEIIKLKAQLDAANRLLEEREREIKEKNEIIQRQHQQIDKLNDTINKLINNMSKD